MRTRLPARSPGRQRKRPMESGSANQAVQRAGASRFGQRRIERQCRLAPVADLRVSCRTSMTKRRFITLAGLTSFAALLVFLAQATVIPRAPTRSEVARTWVGWFEIGRVHV